MRYFLLLILGTCFSLSAKSVEADLSYLSASDSLAYQDYKRAGIDMFNKKDYANAIYYLEKAYDIDRWDLVLQETLFFSYIYMNRGFEARQLYYLLPDASRKAYQLKTPNAITSVYVEGGVMSNVESDYSLPEVTYYKESAVPHLGQNYTARLNHDVGSRVSVSHGVSYSYSSARQQVDSVTTTIFSGDISTKQLSYTVDAPIRLDDGWTVTPAAYVAYVNSQYYQVRFDATTTVNNNPIGPWPAPSDNGFPQGGGGGFYHPYMPNYGNGMYGYGYGYYAPMWWMWNGWNIPSWGGNSYAYKFEKERDESFNYAFDLDVSKIYRHSEFSAALTYLSCGKVNVWKASAQWLCYLKGNLDMYTMLRASYLMREEYDNTHLVEGLVGFKAVDWLWVELGGLLGNMNNYSDRNLNVVYALHPKTSFRIISNLIFPVSDQLSVSLLYRFIKSESSVYYAPTEESLDVKSYSVYGNNLFLGAKWTF